MRKGICISLVVIMSCSASYRAANRLDRIERSVEEWGTATASGLVFVSNTGQFALKYDQPAEDYVRRAREGIQGSAGRLSERAVESRSAVGVNRDKRSEAEDPDAPTVGAPDKVGVKGDLSEDRFSKPLALIQLPNGISEGDALKIGLSQKLNELLLKQLVNPSAIAKHRVYLAVMQISCNPGWRTREGYGADVNITIEYAATPERVQEIIRDLESRAKTATGDERKSLDSRIQILRAAGDITVLSLSDEGAAIQPTGHRPFAGSVFPLLEAQTLDLRNSERDQFAAAIELSAVLRKAGQSASADSVVEAVRRLQFDAATRTARPLITSYSTGLNFGYRFYPSLTALDEPTDGAARSALVLQPVTMPAIVLIVAQEDEIQTWDSIAVSVNNRWAPLKRSGGLKRFTWDWIREIWDKGEAPHVFSNRHRVRRARSFDGALDAYRNVKKFYVRQEIRRRINMLEGIGLGVTRYALIPNHAPKKTPKPTPPSGPPLIHGVTPSALWINDTTVVHVNGRHFTVGGTPVVRSVTFAGRTCEFVVVSDTSMIVRVPAFGDDKSFRASGVLSIMTSPQKPTAESTPMDVRMWRAVDAERRRPRVIVARDSEGRIASITVPNADEVKGADLLRALQRILAGNETAVDIKFELGGEVKANAETKERK